MAMISVGPDSGHLTAIEPDPAKFEWGLQDVSAEDAGRVRDASATMYKQRLAQKRKIKLAWANPEHDAVGRILRAFNTEYVWVRYFDAMADAWQVRQFYVGDRSAPLRWFQTLGGTRYETLEFDIIER